MLVLSRHRDEKVIVQVPGTNDVIEIMVVDIRGDKVRLGVQAPKNYPVHREEVLERIEETRYREAKASFNPIR